MNKLLYKASKSMMKVYDDGEIEIEVMCPCDNLICLYYTIDELAHMIDEAKIWLEETKNGV